jgi:hypothetical protein
LESHHKPAARNTPGKVKKDARSKNSVDAPLNLPHITELIDEGEITIGVVRPVGCVAVASDGYNTLAMLRRRRGESLIQLLTRLDQAIAKANDEDVYTDEING